MDVNLSSDFKVLPIHDPIERRAICVKYAIDAKSMMFSSDSSRTAEEQADNVLAVARKFDEYVAGETS